MRRSTNIFLVGPLGAGKTTIGRQIARAFERDFYDTDREVESKTGVDISWIFDIEGEEGFRERETMVLRKLVKLSNIVLATGGGTILRAENRELLQKNGIVLHLSTDIIRQVKRTSRNKYNRPVLRDVNLRERIKQLSEERNPLYEEIAEKTFLTDNRSTNVVVTEIKKFLKTRESSQS